VMANKADGLYSCVATSLREMVRFVATYWKYFMPLQRIPYHTIPKDTFYWGDLLRRWLKRIVGRLNMLMQCP
jgi:hypothetical protein